MRTSDSVYDSCGGGGLRDRRPSRGGGSGVKLKSRAAASVRFWVGRLRGYLIFLFCVPTDCLPHNIKCVLIIKLSPIN